MKKVLLAGIAAAALYGAPAFAADMPVKAPPPPPAPVSSWTGLYVGGSIGGRWSDDTWTTTGINAGPGVLGPPDPFANPAKFRPSGVRVGGYIGYNWQISPQWVLGIEGDAAWADNKTTVAGIPGTYGLSGLGVPVAGGLTFDSARVSDGADGSLRLRAGYLVTPNWLLYGTGGVAFQQVSMNASCLGSTVNNSWCIAVRNETASSILTGWTVGAGVEVRISPNWFLRGEYRYADYGNLSHTFFAGTIDTVAMNTRFHTNTATLGIAYKFGGPVASKY